MGGRMDVVKGRFEEAVGALFNDNKLRDKGKADQAVGKVKQAAQTAVASAKDAAKKTVDKAKSATNSLREGSP
jgi:uncharacterized protein YjbJ (UPF0337 family)